MLDAYFSHAGAWFASARMAYLTCSSSFLVRRAACFRLDKRKEMCNSHRHGGEARVVLFINH